MLRSKHAAPERARQAALRLQREVHPPAEERAEEDEEEADAPPARRTRKRKRRAPQPEASRAAPSRSARRDHSEGRASLRSRVSFAREGDFCEPDSSSASHTPTPSRSAAGSPACSEEEWEEEEEEEAAPPEPLRARRWERAQTRWEVSCSRLEYELDSLRGRADLAEEDQDWAEAACLEAAHARLERRRRALLHERRR